MHFHQNPSNSTANEFRVCDPADIQTFLAYFLFLRISGLLFLIRKAIVHTICNTVSSSYHLYWCNGIDSVGNIYFLYTKNCIVSCNIHDVYIKG